jgi:NADPH:quinone reductase-like Zn-dependent oxidoreductase
VVVDMAASRVNFADIAKRGGRMPEQLLFIPGHEAAGISSVSLG